MSGTLTAAQALEQLRALGDEKKLDRLVGAALRRAAGRIRSAASKQIRKKGVGRSIWGGGRKSKSDSKGLKKTMLKLSRLEKEGGAPSITITAKGLPAMMEVGGRTKPHVIESEKTRRFRQADRLETKGRKNTAAFLRGQDSKSVLAFKTGGKVAFARRVQHPGSRFPANPSIGPEIQKNLDNIEKELVKAAEEQVAAAKV